jgi:hypothetical protein
VRCDLGEGASLRIATHSLTANYDSEQAEGKNLRVTIRSEEAGKALPPEE